MNEVRIRPLICVGCFSVVALCSFVGAFAQLSPEEALSKMITAEGLEVTLFAAEPDLRNPTCIDVDASGRVWVAEAANYRLFNQDITDEAGDRIRVLEDTDGDGRSDKAWTYYQDPSLQAPLGIAVLGDRVYVCQSPELFYLEDIDGDGRADKKTVILSGFKGVDHDHGLHGIMFGPDGSLYMSNGDEGLDVTDRLGNRIHAGKKNAPIMSATVLRTDFDGTRLELLAQGMRNPYEPAVDAFGNVFISDNDDDGNEQTRINYVMEGGYYGYWPQRKGNRRLDAVHWNEDRPGVVPKMLKTGFGSPTGLMVYEGGLLPKRLHGTLIHADAGPGVIRSYAYEPQGGGYRSDLEVLLSCPEDKWFRPSDVAAAPDGSLIVSDWYDPGVGGHRMVDVVEGRIYRLAPKGSAYGIGAPDLTTEDGIEESFLSPNLARRYLGYRALEAGRAENLLEEMFAKGDSHKKARALWLLAGKPGGMQKASDLSRSATDPALRTQALRILARNGGDSLRQAEWLTTDKDPGVRRQLILELATHSSEAWAFSRLVELARQFDGNDRFYREALGIAFKGREADAFQAITKALGGAWDERLSGLAVQLHPPETLELARAALHDESLDVELRLRAVDAIDAVGSDAAGELLAARAVEDTQPSLQSRALYHLSRDGGQVWRRALRNQPIDDALDKMLMSDEGRNEAWQFIVDAGRAQFVPAFMAIASNPSTSEDERVRALQSIRQLGSRASRAGVESVVEGLTALIYTGSGKVPYRASEALHSLRADTALEGIKTAIFDESLDKALRIHLARVLVQRRSGSVLLARAAEEGNIPEDVILAVGELLHRSRYENVRLIAQQVLPRERTRAGEELPPLASLIKMTGDAPHGREVFFSEEHSQCYRCHVVSGEGGAVGPDLTTIGQKLSIESIFESILSPSAAVAHEYEVWIVQSKREGYLSGYLRSESDDGFEIVDAAGETTYIRTADVLDKYKSRTSLMPTGLASGMTAQELVDVAAYLETLR